MNNFKKHDIYSFNFPETLQNIKYYALKTKNNIKN